MKADYEVMRRLAEGETLTYSVDRFLIGDLPVLESIVHRLIEARVIMQTGGWEEEPKTWGMTPRFGRVAWMWTDGVEFTSADRWGDDAVRFSFSKPSEARAAFRKARSMGHTTTLEIETTLLGFGRSYCSLTIQPRPEQPEC